MRPIKLMSPAREPPSSRRPPAIRRLSISVTMTTAAAETLKSVRRTLCVATFPVDRRGDKTVRGRQRRRRNIHCRSFSFFFFFFFLQPYRSRLLLTSWFYLLVTSSPCSLTTPDTWPFWPRPSRKASTMRTLRPDPSPESKCHPPSTDFLFYLCGESSHPLTFLALTYRCYWGFHGHYSREAEHLFQALESTYQKALQSHLRSSDSIVSLPQSDRSSSSSQESLK